tara:strand:- start:10243 stop:10614 length:372 start_codon:yes stop_codon:yes gene_type:complete
MTQPLPNNSANSSFAPDFGLSKSNAPKTFVSSLGDGFEHRTTIGLNQNPKTFILTFKNISLADANILTNFFDDRAEDGDNISYTIPTESAPMKFVLEGGYTKTDDYANLATVKVKFRQVFDVA